MKSYNNIEHWIHVLIVFLLARSQNSYLLPFPFLSLLPLLSPILPDSTPNLHLVCKVLMGVFKLLCRRGNLFKTLANYVSGISLSSQVHLTSLNVVKNNLTYLTTRSKGHFVGVCQLFLAFVSICWRLKMFVVFNYSILLALVVSVQNVFQQLRLALHHARITVYLCVVLYLRVIILLFH